MAEMMAMLMVMRMLAVRMIIVALMLRITVVAIMEWLMSVRVVVITMVVVTDDAAGDGDAGIGGAGGADADVDVDANVDDGDEAQFPGWPVTIRASQNDGRAVTGYLPELQFTDAKSPVVKVIRERDGEVLYSVRVQGKHFRPAIYESGKYTVKVGQDRPSNVVMTGVMSGAMTDKRAKKVELR